MEITDIQTLFSYNRWANQRIWDAAGSLDDVQYAAPAGFPHGGLRGTLVHILSAEWIWRTRLQEGESPETVFDEKDFPTFESLRHRWEGEEAAMRTWLDSLQDEDLSRWVSYKTTKGKPYENVLWHLLVHLVNHGTQHRSEAAALLTEYGHSPGDLDFLQFVRQSL